MHTWSEQPLRLQELTVTKADSDPKALACYGLLRRATLQAPCLPVPDEVKLIQELRQRTLGDVLHAADQLFLD